MRNVRSNPPQIRNKQSACCGAAGLELCDIIPIGILFCTGRYFEAFVPEGRIDYSPNGTDIPYLLYKGVCHAAGNV